MQEVGWAGMQAAGRPAHHPLPCLASQQDALPAPPQGAGSRARPSVGSGVELDCHHCDVVHHALLLAKPLGPGALHQLFQAVREGPGTERRRRSLGRWHGPGGGGQLASGPRLACCIAGRAWRQAVRPAWPHHAARLLRILAPAHNVHSQLQAGGGGAQQEAGRRDGLPGSRGCSQLHWLTAARDAAHAAEGGVRSWDPSRAAQRGTDGGVPGGR